MSSRKLPLPENTGPDGDVAMSIPSAYPADYVPDANWTPTKEQRDRLRYWDFYYYWVDYAVKKQKGEPVETPGFRSNR
jgi:hypothetical protein